MKISNFCAVVLATTVSSQLLALTDFSLLRFNKHRGADSQQRLAIMSNDPNMPPSAQDNPNDASSFSFFHTTVMSDVVGKTRSINIFGSLTRDIAAVANRLSSKSSNTTLLAPINSAIEALPRKPWEDPHGTTVYEGDDGKDKAQENLTKFVQSHIVPVSPWEEGQKVKTLAGQEIWWTTEGDKKMVSLFLLVKAMWLFVL